MQKIALTSTGPLSGKTTLALELEKVGYSIANHALTLAELFVKYTQGCCYPGMTLKELYDDKEYWRPFLQRFGHDILFDDADRYIDMTLKQATGDLIVFDNVRSNAQARQVKARGFSVVQLHIPEFIRQRRAGSAKQYHRIVQAMTDPIEEPIDRHLVDLRVSGTQAAEVLARNLKEHTVEELRVMPYPLR